MTLKMQMISGEITKADLSQIYKVRVDVFDMMIKHLQLPPRSSDEVFSKEELEKIIKGVGRPYTERKPQAENGWENVEMRKAANL